MSLLLDESWYNLPEYLIGNAFNSCQASLEIEVNLLHITEGSNQALINLNLEHCSNGLVINNKAAAQNIILNFQHDTIKIAKIIKILGPSASLTMISSSDAYFYNISANNIQEITIISGVYKGLELGNNKLFHDILYDKVNAGIWINNWRSNSFVVSSAKIVMTGEITLPKQLIMVIFGVDNQNYNLDTNHLITLTTNLLKISDLSNSGAGINLLGEVKGVHIFIDGHDFIFKSNQLTAQRFLCSFKGTSYIEGHLSAAKISILSDNLVIQNGGEINSVSFKAPNYIVSATGVNLTVKSNFNCDSSGAIYSNARIIIKATDKIYYNGVAEATSDIKFEGEAAKEIGILANIVSHQGDIIFNNDTKMPGHLIICGLVATKQGYIRYIIGEYFKTSGISAGTLGIKITQNNPDLATVEINKAEDLVLKRWKEELLTDSSIDGSLIAFSKEILINANIVLLNNGAMILNLARVDETLSFSRVEINADKYIYHDQSSIIANGDIIQNANGENSEGLGLVFSDSTRIESIEGALKIFTLSSIKLNGNLTGNEGVFIEARCLENNDNSTIHGLHGEIKINLKNCHFKNYGRMYSNTTLLITVDGGDIENHNIMAGDDMKITGHGRHNFINYGRIYSNNNLRIGLEIDAKILLKPESLIYVGSYDFGHFFDLVRLRIGEVECHGCTIETIKPITSIISASVLSVRITDYKKTDYQLVAQIRFLTESRKEKTTVLGFNGSPNWHISHATLSMIENHHSYYGPAQMKHTGDVIFDVGEMKVDKSSVTGRGTAYFPNKGILAITSEQTDKKVIAPRGTITHLNTQDNVKNSFGISSAEITSNYGATIFTQPKDTVNSVLAFRNFEGDFLRISLGSGKSYLGNNEAMLPGTNCDGSTKIMADITIDAASKGKTVIVYNWKSGLNELETITPEYLQTYGFDISKLIHPRILNSKIWGHLSKESQRKIVQPISDEEFSLQPLFFLKDDPFLAPFINDPLNIVHFLAGLAFSQKGLVYTIGDGHFIAKLVDEGVFILLGILSNVDNSKLIQSLAVNAFYEQKQQGLIAGNPLNPEQIQSLTSCIIWPVWLDNCLGNERCLDFKLYFNNEALKNSVSGAVMVAEGTININVLGDVLIGLNGQIKAGEAIKFDLQGNFVNLGAVSSGTGTSIAANNIGNAGKINVDSGDLNLKANYDIINFGSAIVKDGDVYLKAGHDIRELILINSNSPVPELTKRAIYAVGGSLYYLAERDIVQQATAIFASGNVIMQAGNDIKIETVHRARVVKEEHSNKHYLIQSTIDQYDAIIIVNGTIKMTAGHNFIGSGVKLSSSNGDIIINADNEAVLEDNTGYAWNHQGVTKEKFLSKSTVAVSWTVDKTANLQITAPGGKVYLSSKECILEGGIIEGEKPIFKCDKLVIKTHEVKKHLEMRVSKRGIAPKVPAVDLINSDQPETHLRDHTIVGPINSLLKMQGPLDLLPAVNLISSIPGLKASYQLLKGSTAGFSPAALVGALLSKYISTSISYERQQTRTSITQTISTLAQIRGNQCEFSGKDGTISANIDCHSSLSFEFDNVKLSGAKDTMRGDSQTESSGFTVGASLSGVSFGISIGDSSFTENSVAHKQGTYYSKNISIKVNNKLEIENAQIDGENVTIEALIVEINQVVDSSRSEGKSSGASIGVNIGWAGTVTPTGSISYGENLKQSQVVQFISGISGEDVSVTAKKLAYNIESIKAEKELKILVENIDYIAMPHTENIDTETQISASVSVRPDGKSSYFASLYSRDGDEVMSIGWSSDLIEGIRDIVEAVDSLLGSDTNIDQNNLAVIDREKLAPEGDNNEEDLDKTKKDAKDTDNKNEAKNSKAYTDEANDNYYDLYNNDNHKAGSTLGSCPGDGPGVCSSGYGIKETVNGNNYLRPTNSLSFTEFENHLISELSIEKGDIGATDYIQEKYQEYLATGKAETSNFGLEMHKGGFLVDKFKADHPNANKAIKFVVDNTGKAVGLLVDGALYVLSPLKPVWEVYRDAVNALVLDVINEWVGNKEKQAGKGLKNWEKGLTSKQKLVLDTSIEGVEFGGNLAVIGGTVKLAGKLIIEDALKVVTKADKPNIKTHGEANPYVDSYHNTNYHQPDLDSLGKLPGPELPARQTSTYASGFNNRLLKADEHFYRYHGVDNLSGKKYSYFTNKKYNCEIELRSGLGIEDSWGIDITKVTEVKVPAGNWVSEGVAGSQLTYKGGDYQAVLSNVPKQWIVKTEKAFKNE